MHTLNGDFNFTNSSYPYTLFCQMQTSLELHFQTAIAWVRTRWGQTQCCPLNHIRNADNIIASLITEELTSEIWWLKFNPIILSY